MKKFRIVKDKKYGYRRLDPIPATKDIKEFYQKRYYDLIKKGGRACELRRIMAGGEESKSELKWLTHTYYSDIHDVLEIHIYKRTKSLLDIGSGTGDFLKYMLNKGWDVVGVEPSKETSRTVERSGLTIFNCPFEDFIVKHQNFKQTFDAITLLNVLEHVPDPAKIVQHTKEFLKPHTGIICIRVPNDFNKLQFYADKKLKKTKWWVAIPDHINYFNFKSLRKLVESFGFKIIYKTTDFPMELFLLMGDDYVDNDEVGSKCHQKRMQFEMALPDDLRRKIYQRLASLGLGRSCIIYAKAP